MKRIAVATAALALAASSAAAEPNPDASAIAEQGFDAYDRGDYAAAITFFERANEIAPAPGLLFNIAQSYRKLGSAGCEPALGHYRRYATALEDSGAAVPEAVRARIVEMSECAAPKPALEAAAEPEPVAEPEPQPRPAWTPSVDQPSPGSGRAIAGWVLLGAGAAALTTAAITGGIAIDRESDLAARCSGDVCPPGFESRVASYDRLRYTAFSAGAVGAIAAVAGGWLIWTSRSPEAPRQLSARIGPGSVGVSCAF